VVITAIIVGWFAVGALICLTLMKAARRSFVHDEPETGVFVVGTCVDNMSVDSSSTASITEVRNTPTPGVLSAFTA
jgi:hypothetical protein